MSRLVRIVSGLGLGIVLGGIWAASLSGQAMALDCPCTWEEVVCGADAVAEVEMVLATKTTPDRMEVRRVIWNRTNHRIRPMRGYPNIPHATKTRFDLLASLARYRLEGSPSDPEPEFIVRYRRALARGSYRTMVFLEHFPGTGWSGGGVAYKGEQWLDHPDHAAWWTKIQPLLHQYIDAAKRNEKPAFCADVSREATRFKRPY